jgi:hypothetical protein
MKKKIFVSRFPLSLDYSGTPAFRGLGIENVPSVPRLLRLLSYNPAYAGPI